MDTGRNILLIESDERSAQDVLRFLKVSAYSFSVSHVSGMAEAINYLHNRRPDLLLLDADFMSHKDFASLKSITQRENLPIVLLSDSGTNMARSQAATAGAIDFLTLDKLNLFHLQKTIVTALKINETEEKLESTLSSFASQSASFHDLLNHVDQGILVLNQNNALRFANTRAYSILSESFLKKYLAEYVCYRELDEEEQIVLHPQNGVTVTLKVSKLKWNDEQCNLFVMDKTNSQERQNIFSSDSFKKIFAGIDGNILITKNDKVEYATPGAAKMLRRNLSEMTGTPVTSLVQSNANTVSGISIQSFMANKQAEGLIILEDGSTQPVMVSSKPVSIDDELYYIMALESRELHNELGAPGYRTEVNAFSSEAVLHLASHDLREPVRTILNYVQLISDKLIETNYEEATEYAGFAKDAAERMEKLLSDLKLYISLNNYNFQMTKVAVKLSVNDIIKGFKQRIQDSGALVSIGELPEISADRELLERLFSQLIDNAIKFQKKDRKPIVDIGFDKHDGKIVFCVRDNGIGISKKYHDKVFELFERLNRVDEFTGNGLGLAICKKIVEMHGGKIWIESLPGFGSSIYFTLQPGS